MYARVSLISSASISVVKAFVFFAQKMASLNLTKYLGHTLRKRHFKVCAANQLSVLICIA